MSAQPPSAQELLAWLDTAWDNFLYRVGLAEKHDAGREQHVRELADILDAHYKGEMASLRAQLHEAQQAREKAEDERDDARAELNDYELGFTSPVYEVKRQAEADLSALREYVQHKPGCAARTEREFCRHHGGDGSTNGCPACQGLPRRRSCDCGLDALLSPVLPGEEGRQA